MLIPITSSDHYHPQADYQASKKIKSSVALAPDFGAGIGWTSGPPMMDLLTPYHAMQQPRTSDSHFAWSTVPGTSLALDPRQPPAQQSSNTFRGHRRHQSMPSVPTYRPAYSTLGTISEQTNDELDAFFNLDDDTYFYGEFEHVDERLSLGEIVWTAPLPAAVALPSTYQTAEGLARFPPPMPRRNAKHSISKYATHDQTSIQAACIPIKLSPEWPSIQADPIFCDLSNILRSPPPQRPRTADRPRSRQTLETLPEAMEVDADKNMAIMQAQDILIQALHKAHASDNLRNFGSGHEPSDRQTGNVRSTIEAPPTPSDQPRKTSHRRANSFDPQASAFVKPNSHSHSASLHILPAFDFRPAAGLKPALKGQHGRARSQSPKRNVAFIREDDDSTQSPQEKTSHRSRSMSPQRLPAVPEPKRFAVDNAQEDILARLGVTGTAQKVYATPGPALNPSSGVPSRIQSVEQRDFRFPAPAAPDSQMRDSGPIKQQALQPLQEIHANAASFGGHGWKAKKRSRGQSQDIDANTKRAREFETMHSGGAIWTDRW